MTHTLWKHAWEDLITAPPATYWTLQDLGDPLLLLHHTEVLPQVRRHGPAAEGLVVAAVHAVQGQGERARWRPHLHHAHVVTAAELCKGGQFREKQLVLCLGCQGNWVVISNRFASDSCNYSDGDRQKKKCGGHCHMRDAGVFRMQSRMSQTQLVQNTLTLQTGLISLCGRA